MDTLFEVWEKPEGAMFLHVGKMARFVSRDKVLCCGVIECASRTGFMIRVKEYSGRRYDIGELVDVNANQYRRSLEVFSVATKGGSHGKA